MNNISIKFEVVPFPVPSEVVTIPQNKLPGLGKTQKMTFDLSQIEVDQLSMMCDAFRASIFDKAGKCDPRLAHKRNPCMFRPVPMMGVDNPISS